MGWEGGSKGHERGKVGSGLLGASCSRKAGRLAKGEATFPGSLRKASACSLLPFPACPAGLVLDLHAQRDAGVPLAYGALVGHLGILASKPAMGTPQPT